MVRAFRAKEAAVEIRTERLEIPVGNERMGAYLARPVDAAPRPGVMLISSGPR